MADGRAPPGAARPPRPATADDGRRAQGGGAAPFPAPSGTTGRSAQEYLRPHLATLASVPDADLVVAQARKAVTGSAVRVATTLRHRHADPALGPPPTARGGDGQLRLAAQPSPGRTVSTVGKRAKSRSSDTTVQPCSTATAARTASGSRSPEASASWHIRWSRSRCRRPGSVAT